jgi:hypothetical protein
MMAVTARATAVTAADAPITTLRGMTGHRRRHAIADLPPNSKELGERVTAYPFDMINQGVSG